MKFSIFSLSIQPNIKSIIFWFIFYNVLFTTVYFMNFYKTRRDEFYNTGSCFMYRVSCKRNVENKNQHLMLMMDQKRSFFSIKYIL
jgi:hypothetical protein